MNPMNPMNPINPTNPINLINLIVIPSGVPPAQFQEWRLKDEGLQGWKVKVYQGWYNLEDFGDTFVQIDQGWCILYHFGPKIVENVCQNYSKTAHGDLKMDSLDVKMVQMEPSGP